MSYEYLSIILSFTVACMGVVTAYFGSYVPKKRLEEIENLKSKIARLYQELGELYDDIDIYARIEDEYASITKSSKSAINSKFGKTSSRVEKSRRTERKKKIRRIIDTK